MKMEHFPIEVLAPEFQENLLEEETRFLINEIIAENSKFRIILVFAII